jgi:hypothetical protein
MKSVEVPRDNTMTCTICPPPPPMRLMRGMCPGGHKEMSSILADQQRPRMLAQMRGRGGVPVSLSTVMANGAHINFGDLTPYFIYACDVNKVLAFFVCMYRYCTVNNLINLAPKRLFTLICLYPKKNIYPAWFRSLSMNFACSVIDAQ